MTSKMPNARVTLAQVAARANVSMATASKAMNGNLEVAATTRSAVLTAADELGYRVAERISDARGGSLYLVSEGISAPREREIVLGALEEGAAADRTIMIRIQHNLDSAEHLAWLKGIRGTKVDGMLLVSSSRHENMTPLDRMDFPIVIIDPEVEPPSPIRSVVALNRTGAMAATDHLIRLGHRRIAFVASPEGVPPGTGLREGYSEAVYVHGVDPASELVVERPDIEETIAAVESLLSSPFPPTAIFAADSLSSRVILDRAASLGLSVPEDISVIRFDDGLVDAAESPEMTMIRRLYAEMGRRAVRHALSGSHGRRINRLAFEISGDQSVAPRNR